MHPGDVVTCNCCGAQVRATWSSQERPWQEGWPCSLIWTHGPRPRWHVTSLAPSLCSWCFERRQALGADAEPLYRPAPGAENMTETITESDVGEGPFRVEPGDRGGSSSSVQKAPLERPTPRYVRSKRRPAGELPPLPACAACGTSAVVWAFGRPWCDACAAAHAEQQAAATLVEDLDLARIAAYDEDERRRGRPELSIACPACHVEQGLFCRDYRGKKKPTCRARLEAPGAVAALERYRKEADRARRAADLALPPAEPAPHAPAYVDDLAAGRVQPAAPAPTQLGLF